MRAAIERSRRHGLGERDDVLADAGGAERQHGLNRGARVGQRGRPLRVDRVDDEDSQLGLVARVPVVVERAERMQRGEPSSGKRRGRLAQPDLVPIRREDTDALARSEAAAAENA